MIFTLKKALLTLACTLALPLGAYANDDSSNTKATAASAEQLTIARIYSSPSLNGQTPKSLKFSPDGSMCAAADIHGYLTLFGFGSSESYKVSDGMYQFCNTRL